jgi:hypothetical protein
VYTQARRRTTIRITTGNRMSDAPSLSLVTPESLTMKNVYLFMDGASEFTPPPGTKVNKTFRKNQVDKFLSAPARVVSEFPLQMFSTWFQDLPLNDLMTRNEAEDCDEVWQYKVILLYPTIVPTTKAEVNRFTWAKAAAMGFYGRSFYCSEKDSTCIEKALAYDPTIMIVGRQFGKGVDRFKKSIIQCKDAVVISCITFRMGIGDECAGSSSVLWLLVAESTAQRPSYVPSWRRQGFGRLMLSMLIKRSTFELLSHKNLSQCQESLPGVDIYLQCTQASAMAFYHACGFVQINTQGTTGFELLPKTIADSCAGESNGNFAWIVPESEEHCIIPLMRLRSGSLLNSARVNVAESGLPGIGGGRFVWCRYPPATLMTPNPGASLPLTNTDLEGAYAGLDLLNNLLPLPMGVILGPNKMHTSGELLSTERVLHSSRLGTHWMSNSELSMMTALLMKDGRYDASVAILTISDMLRIRDCIKALQTYMNSKTMAKQLGLEEKNATTIKCQFATYEGQMNSIVKNLLFFNPGLLQKKILVFPCNIKNSHWGATFVFNPGDIEAAFDDASSCRTCFFRYCSLHPSGTRKIPNEFGIIWFLNLAFSYQEQQRRKDCNPSSTTFAEKMEWLIPYGKAYFGEMKGSKTFPALRVLENGVLPLQNDDHSCGIGLIAAIAIILRDIIGKDNCGTDYNKMFSREHMEVKVITDIDDDTGIERSEHMCCFPSGTFRRLPTGDELGSSSYLHVVKAQWFLLFDRIAELQHVTVPKRHNADHSVDDAYETLKGLLQTFSWPERPVLSIVKESCVTSQNDVGDSKQSANPKDDLPVDEGTEAAPVASLDVPAPSEMNVYDMQGRIESPPPLDEDNDDYEQAGNNEEDGVKEESVEVEVEGHDHGEEKGRDDEDDHQEKHEQAGKNEEEGVEDEESAEEESIEEESVEEESVEEESVEEESVEEESEGHDDGEENDQEKHEQAGNTEEEGGEEDLNVPAVMLPPPLKVWDKGKLPNLSNLPFSIPDEIPKEHVARSRYKTFVSDNDVEKFTKKWRRKGDDKKERPVVCRDEEAMNEYVEDKFVHWGWSSTQDHHKDLEKKRRIMQRKIEGCKKKTTKDEYRQLYTDQITFMKKERRRFRRAFELEWMFGHSAMVHGLKYNPREDTFEARLVYSAASKEGKLEQKEEIMFVSKDWILDAEYGEGVMQHVINLGSTDEFVTVPPGKSVFIHTKKVHRLRYVPPHTQWVPDPHHKRSRHTGKSGKRMMQVQAPGYWEVIFHGETKPMRTDDQFVSQFKKGFLEEVKRLRRGFVDIPVGDFKVSHLKEHPNLLVPEAPSVHFVQSEGEDLCVSKSLASVFYVIGFVDQAVSINHYGERELSGGTVDAIRKVGQYAETLLPKWITRKVLKRPHMLDWQLLQEKMKNTIVLGVLNESDGNGSHAVTIHGGYVYDANEEVAIPLCKEALDYCCSTSTVKNKFVSFRKATLFFYEGTDVIKKTQLTLLREGLKRKRDDV